MKKRMTIMIILLILVFGGIFGWNAVGHYFMKQYFANFQPPPASVSTTKAQQADWQAYLTSVGNLTASDGVDITPEASGIVTDMPFTSGQMVKKGDLLAKIDDRIEQAQLLNDMASQRLAKINFERTQDLYQKKAISRSQLDEVQAKLSQADAAVAKTKALIAQKNITAPFDGKIGIKLIDTWQFVNAGTPLVTLQGMDPMKISFYLPEQELPQLALQQPVIVKVAPFPGKEFKGEITAINAKVDPNTHNILVQATLPNSDKLLVPGLFGDVAVQLPQQKQVVVAPEAAIDFSLFGDSIYVVSQTDQDKDGKPILVAKRRFVVTGDRQKGLIVITKGIKAGEEIVTSGQTKLNDGTKVVINNTIQPV